MPSELVTTHTSELLAQWVGAVLPVLLAPDARTEGFMEERRSEHLAHPAAVGHIGKAVAGATCASERAVAGGFFGAGGRASCTHLTRLFVRHAGTRPMRYLTEIRVTEFARPIEETDMSETCAVRSVGWGDPRVAAEWLRQRFGITPSQYRSART